jgi:hypothetical protein
VPSRCSHTLDPPGGSTPREMGDEVAQPVGWLGQAGSKVRSSDEPEGVLPGPQVRRSRSQRPAARLGGAGRRKRQTPFAVPIPANGGGQDRVRADLRQNTALTCGNPNGAPPVEGPSKAAALLKESGMSNRVPSRASSLSPRHHEPGVSGVTSGPATWRNSVASTSSPSRVRARHSDG